MRRILSGLYLVGCVSVWGLKIQNHVVTRVPTLALPDVFGPVTTDMFERAQRRRSEAAKKAHLVPGRGRRASDSCDMCVNLVLHQDTTLDWTPEFRAQIGGQFQHILQDLHDTHPGSTFSVVTFQDKPIPELGEATDYCVSYDARMVSDPISMLETYATTPEGVGYDWPENHFGSLYELLNSPTYLPWSQHSDCSSLIITITDASPHFEGDEWQSDYPQLAPYTTDYDEATAESFCSQKYYPSPWMVAEALLAINAYHGTIVWRAGDLNSLALRSWSWFDSLVGGEDAFTQAIFDDDQDWMTPLENVLRAFIGTQCDPPTSTAAPPSSETPSTAMPTYPSETAGGSTPVATNAPVGTEGTLNHSSESTSASTTTTNSEESVTSIQVTPDGEQSTASPAASGSTAVCNCPSEDPCCLVQPELYLMIKKKPSEFDLHMKG